MHSENVKPSCLDKPIPKPKGEINLSTFAFLITEMVIYCNKRSGNPQDFQTKLLDFGRFVGVRLLDLTYYRDKNNKRETKFQDQLNFIKKYVWKSIYGREAESVEKDANNAQLFYIIEKDPIINKFLPTERAEYSCAFINAGIIDAILNESNFPCKTEVIHLDGNVYYAITVEKSVISK